MHRLLESLLLVLLAVPAAAEEPGIQDNSFLLEEAYNQEPGVVQHISLFSRQWPDGSWQYAFTQEWPVRGQRHQLSYTLALAHAGDGGATSFGDTLLNYRYQLVGSGETRLAIAPRLSLLLPTGRSRDGLGTGGVGVQTSFPLSLVLGARWVTHFNAGFTRVGHAEDPTGDTAGTSAVYLGQSLIFLTSTHLNLMVESLWSRSEAVVGPGRTEWQESSVVSPGLRWAYNFPSGLQIVPGLALPIGLGTHSGEKTLLVYLSFEHPFRHSR
jgi:hypothetical protein